MSEPCTLELSVPEELLEQIAGRVADLIRTNAPIGKSDAASESPWLTVKEAAAYLGCSRHALYRHTAAKAIPFRKRRGGQGLLFRRDELDRWIEAHYDQAGVRA